MLPFVTVYISLIELKFLFNNAGQIVPNVVPFPESEDRRCKIRKCLGTSGIVAENPLLSVDEHVDVREMVRGRIAFLGSSERRACDLVCEL